MKQILVLIALLTAFAAVPGFAFAQRSGGIHGGMMHAGMKSAVPDQQQIVVQAMADNIAAMSGIMHDMHQMMAGGKMTEEHHKKMMFMINRMGCMMEEMTGPHGAHLGEQHRNELQDMRGRVDGMKAELQKQGKKPGFT